MKCIWAYGRVIVIIFKRPMTALLGARRYLAISVILFAMAPSTESLAHHFWLEPERFVTESAADLPVRVIIGAPDQREPWKLRWERLVGVRTLGPKGLRDQQKGVHEGEADGVLMLQLPEPGLHILTVETQLSDIELSAKIFNEYVAEEGLSLVAQHRQAKGRAAKPGREIYSRRSKSLIYVRHDETRAAPEPSPDATKPLGQTLEIVPARNPYDPGFDGKLPVMILYHGAPLPGALVSLSRLDRPDRSAVTQQKSDSDGTANFIVPREGRWLINVLWSRPINGHKRADYETIFASMTFGF